MGGKSKMKLKSRVWWGEKEKKDKRLNEWIEFGFEGRS